MKLLSITLLFLSLSSNAGSANVVILDKISNKVRINANSAKNPKSCALKIIKSVEDKKAVALINFSESPSSSTSFLSLTLRSYPPVNDVSILMENNNVAVYSKNVLRITHREEADVDKNSMTQTTDLEISPNLDKIQRAFFEERRYTPSGESVISHFECDFR